MDITPEKTAFVFPGQGAQKIGMGEELAKKFPTAGRIFDRADNQLGETITKIAWEGPEEKLNDTYNTQPALLTHSTAALMVFQEYHPGFKPAFYAGHSMGEFSALVAAGSMGYEDALQLVRKRGELMKEAGNEQPGGMAAILGLDIETVDNVCRLAMESGGIVQVANDNCPGQVVISGMDSALDRAIELAKSRGARKVTKLPVSIASHSPLMTQAQSKFINVLDKAPIGGPLAPIIGNVNALPLVSPQQIQMDLKQQLISRVRWTESILFMIDHGVNVFIELGSGSVLTSILKRINKEVTGISIGNPDDFNKLIAGEV